MIVDVSSQYIKNLCQWWGATATDWITNIDDCRNGFYMDILTHVMFDHSTMAFLPVCLIANT